MNFSIELEANYPLDIPTLYNVLASASSPDRQQVQVGAQQLFNWEKRDGYYSGLQSIFIDVSLPIEIRHLSAIQLKHGIDKYWRKAATNSIRKEEKALIRSRCLDYSAREPDHRLALQNALIVSKIIRFEYPHDWPDAISSILEKLRIFSKSPETSLELFRVLLILLYTIKELATGQLRRIKDNLHNVAPEILQVLVTIYSDKVAQWQALIQNGSGDDDRFRDAAERSLLALRILRRLIIAGYDFPNRDTVVPQFWNQLSLQLDECLSFVLQGSLSTNVDARTLVEKHLIQTAKFHLEMVKSHPAGFALLPNSVDLARAYWSLIFRFSKTFGSQTPTPKAKIGHDGDADEEKPGILEELSLKGLLLLRSCLKMVFSPAQTFRYQHAEDKDEKKRSVELMKNALFTESFVSEIMETIVTQFFVFRSRDLRDWVEEPEEWERREEGEGDVWEFSIRSCSEKLFLDLVINFNNLLVEPLLSFFANVAVVANTNVLLKDSVYAAIGIAAPVLEERLDFSTFLESTLVPEVQIQQAGYNVLRRRIAIILGQWMLVKEGLNRPLVYQIFQYLLDKTDSLNDQVVRVTAGRQLKNVIDPFEFLAEPFMPYTPVILGRLMHLIDEVELSETKLALLNTISVIVLKMDHHISPLADQIISLLSPLWSQAGEEYLMKQSILGILSALVSSMKAESQKYHAMIIPLIDSSVQLTSPTRVYLLEEAMDLWATILVQTSSPAPQETISLAQHLFPMYEAASDALRKALEITETYILLIPQHFLSESTHLLVPFSSLLGATKREAIGVITRLVELLVQSAEYIGGLQAVSQLTTNLVTSQFLYTLLTGLRTAYSAHQTTGPNRASSSIDGVVETDYLSVLARLALASPSLFTSALTAAWPQENFETTISWLLAEWFSHIDNIGDPERKKLSCLALTNLLQAGQPWILNHLQELMTVWTDTITELFEDSNDNNDLSVDGGGGGGGGGVDCLVYLDEQKLRPEGPEAPADERRRRLSFADPVHRLDVKVFLRERLQGAAAACGGQEAFEKSWVVNVDKDVLSGFGGLGVV